MTLCIWQPTINSTSFSPLMHFLSCVSSFTLAKEPPAQMYFVRTLQDTKLTQPFYSIKTNLWDTSELLCTFGNGIVAVEKVSGNLVTLAGNITHPDNVFNRLPLLARFDSVRSLEQLDANQKLTVFFTDMNNHCVRSMENTKNNDHTSWVMVSFAGSCGIPADKFNKQATHISEMKFSYPQALAMNKRPDEDIICLFVLELSGKIKRIAINNGLTQTAMPLGVATLPEGQYNHLNMMSISSTSDFPHLWTSRNHGIMRRFPGAGGANFALTQLILGGEHSGFKDGSIHEALFNNPWGFTKLENLMVCDAQLGVFFPRRRSVACY